MFAELGALHPSRRNRIVRWGGLIPATLVLFGATAGWLLFGELLVGNTLEDGGTEALGAAVDIAAVDVGRAPNDG